MITKAESSRPVAAPTATLSPSRRKTLLVFWLTILAGYALFVAPNVFLGVSKINGGLQGVNLLWMALFQCASVVGLIYLSLRTLGRSFRDIGWSFQGWKQDVLLGILGGGGWLALQFLVIIPNTGGAERADIVQMVSTMDGTVLGLLSYGALGVVGGGITEEIFNRGYFINVLKSTFGNPTVGVWIASVVSILVFALGHLPTDALSCFDILVPTVTYTLLFLYTKRLTPSIVAHGVYNAGAILSVYVLYY